jgi:hypothetical protein
MSVKDGDHVHAVAIHDVTNDIRKSGEQRLANATVYHSLQIWRALEPLEYSINGGKKLVPEANSLFLVPLIRFLEICLRLRLKHQQVGH